MANHSLALSGKYTDRTMTMRFFEFNTRPLKPIKPQTPDQARIASLQQQKDRASQALKTERERQKIARSQAALTNLHRSDAGE